MEQPTDEINKQLHEQAHHSKDRAIMKVALSSALIAVLAAVASMLSEHQSNEAMLNQLKASDQWAFYQAKGIKHNLIYTHIVLLEAQGFKNQTKLDKMKATREKYQNEQTEISKEATKDQDDAQKALKSHKTLSYAETFLQVAIGISAISALTRRRWLWITSLFIASGGIAFLTWGLLRVFEVLS